MSLSYSYCLSPTRNSTPQPLLFHNPQSHIGKQNLAVFSAEFRRPRSKFPILNPIPKSSLSILTLQSNGFSRPLAAFSSFAESEDGGENDVVGEKSKPRDGGEMLGMAEAFGVSPRTASAISVCIAAAALCLPLFMRSLGLGLGFKTRVLSYVTLLFGFYMAWNIGANDVANAMGTSVGSGALSLRQAVVMAAVLEFSGALLMGTHVTSTMQKGILVANVFQGKDTLLFAGLLSSLAAAGTWLQVASYYVLMIEAMESVEGQLKSVRRVS